MSTTLLDDCDACKPSGLGPPLPIANRPGLPALQYRIRTFATFRQAMLARIPFERVGSATPGARWTGRESDDFGIALIDMWAYVADILTFYQERIANESFLRTAVLRESLRRLAALLDYRPAPGLAATTYLAFSLQPPSPSTPQTIVGPRLRAQSVPGQNEKPQKFETEETRVMRASWNRLLPVTREPQQLTTRTIEIYLRGRVTTLRPGDALLIVGDERVAEPGNERWDLRFVTAIAHEADQTRVTLGERLGLALRRIMPGTNPRVYAFRRRASLFGFNAPVLNTLPLITRHTLAGHALDIRTTMTTVRTGDTTSTVTTATTIQGTPSGLPDDWDFTQDPPGPDIVDLDAEYAGMLPGAWVALSRPGYVELYRVEKVSAEARADYTLSGKVTRLQLDTTENLLDFKVSTRETTVYWGAEELPFDDRPVAAPVEGHSVDVVGDHGGLERGRPLVLAGTAAGKAAQEVAFLLETTPAGPNTRLHFVDALANRYDRDTLQIYANAVRATHGDTVREVLGSADAARAFQSFTLQKQPLTFVPRPGAPGGAGSTLEVRVNDLLWEQVRSFYGHSPREAIYSVQLDEQGTATIRLGNGETGKRPPTGRNNVTAVYRTGIGQVGNVRAGTITTLLDRPTGVRSVTNPIAAQGGAEPESGAAIRRNAPNTVRTFGRIVSLRDFEDAAREHAGVAKARATLWWSGEERYVRLVVAGDRGAQLLPGQPSHTALLQDLDSRRDPNRAMRLESYVRVPIVLTASVVVDQPTYLPENVLAGVRAALVAYFDFDNLDIGQPIYLSDLYRVMHDVAGVVAVDIDRFSFKQMEAEQPSRAAFIRAQASRGMVLTPRGGRLVADPVQVFAAARSDELIWLEDPDADLALAVASPERAGI